MQIRLTGTEARQLAQVAREQKRDPRDQAALFVRRGLGMERQTATLQRLLILGQACALGLMLPEKAQEELMVIVSEMSVPYVITEAGEAALSP